MAKNAFHDVMTKENRSIRRVPISRRERDDDETSEDVFYERDELQIEEPPSSSWRRIFLWGIVVVFLALLGFAVSTSFTGASVKVQPKTKSIVVDHEFTAQADGAAIRFVALPVNETADASLPAAMTKKVSERASGTIVIYNNFSEKPQRLIKNTRFETPDGLIYRIGNSLTVPGKMVKNGKTLPGSIEAAVAADATGAEYNIALSDFTIPGFKNDPARFSGFYARSKAPMSGGIEGVVKVPEEAALIAAQTSLRNTLANRVGDKAYPPAPQGYVFFRGALLSRSESLPLRPASDSSVTVTERLAGTAFAFDRESVVKEIAKVALGAESASAVDIPRLEELAFEFRETPSNEGAGAKAVRFTLKGTVLIVWKYDHEKLRLALAGRERDELPEVLKDFPAIAKADFVIRPFWSRSFPRNPRKVSIETVSVGAE